MATGKLVRLSCDPKCGFEVQSHEEGEVLEIAKNHAKIKHGSIPSIEELRGMLKLIG
jgi:predicted small metal-binding protein